MEAAAAGTPSVAFRVGGLQESIVDGETGILADTFQEFVDALRMLLRSRDERERMGAAARDRAALFSWEATASAFAVAIDGLPVEADIPAGLMAIDLPTVTREPA
jgi:glycosyltransferase involved in cell wall biosynthesis